MKERGRVEAGEQFMEENIYRPTEMMMWFIATFMFMSIATFILRGALPGLLTVGIGTFLGHFMWTNRRRASYILFVPRLRDGAWMCGLAVGFAAAMWAEHSVLIGFAATFAAAGVILVVWWLCGAARYAFGVF